jgi:hypothetical protein
MKNGTGVFLTWRFLDNTANNDNFMFCPVQVKSVWKKRPYGLSRMFDALVFNEGWETMVFRSKKAVEWLRKRVKEKFGIDNLTLN